MFLLNWPLIISASGVMLTTIVWVVFAGLAVVRITHGTHVLVMSQSRGGVCRLCSTQCQCPLKPAGTHSSSSSSSRCSFCVCVCAGRCSVTDTAQGRRPSRRELALRHQRPHALRLAQSQKVDLWVINTVLADMSGVDLCRMLKDRSLPPVIYMVADVYHVEDERAARCCGVSLFGCKPIQASWFKSCVKVTNY